MQNISSKKTRRSTGLSDLSAHRCRFGVATFALMAVCAPHAARSADETVTLNQKTDGYRGIWQGSDRCRP